MGNVMVLLAILSSIALIIGFVWVLITSGRTHEFSGSEAGEEIMADQLADEWEEPLAQKTAFKGRAIKRERAVSISFKEIKGQLRRRQWSTAAPVLLAIGGFLGLLAFGSLALFGAIENELVGGLIAAISLVTVLRILIRLARA